jgi:quercetin dioxygenase-like cupin family protein
MDAEDMKKWTKLTVYAVGEDVTTIKAGDVVYIGVNAIKGAEAIEVDGGIKLMVSEYDIAIVW